MLWLPLSLVSSGLMSRRKEPPFISYPHGPGWRDVSRPRDQELTVKQIKAMVERDAIRKAKREAEEIQRKSQGDGELYLSPEFPD